MAKYWLPHREQVWAVGKVIEQSADQVRFSIESGFVGEKVSLPVEKLQELDVVQDDQEEGLDDICSLTTVHEAALLYAVRTRYAQDIIYTRSMRVLIALNPFRSLPIYSTQHVDQYMGAADSLDLSPHIFAIGQDAIRGLRTSANAQAILISGESGAGKTESAKLILSFVAESVRASGGSVMGIEERVMLTNPVLEAFGNAMTVRNKNSSRFGKWLDLQYASCTELTGGMLTSYLLETTRVCGQAQNERGYHIFFQLLQARRQPQFVELGLQEPKRYKYLKDGQSVIQGINDERNFQEMREALTALRFDDRTQLDVFKVVAGVLNLGNCEIEAEGDDACKIVDFTPVMKTAELLGVDMASLRTCLLMKKMVIGKEVTEAPLKAEQARAVRDGLARLLYGRLFLWLIQRMNAILGASDLGSGADPAIAKRQRLLGILDIAGFENFEFNSLSQFLINLSNEHLQQHFNTVMIKEDVEDCLSEGVTVPSVGSFEDNADILAFIDGKGGVFDLLDETMTMPKANEMSFVTKVSKQDHKRFVAAKNPRMATCSFGIIHYAGEVIYNCEGWLEKNADRPPDNAAEMLKGSTMEVLQEIGGVLDSEVAPSSARGQARKAKSVSSVFRTSVKALMQKIHLADPHYIRCIKPNSEKVPGKFTACMVMEQLILGGVLATVRIRQQGYAYRMDHIKFIHNYACIKRLSGSPEGRGSGGATLSTTLQQHGNIESFISSIRLPEVCEAMQTKAIAIGNTKVFMKTDVYKALEAARVRVLFDNVVTLQSLFRGCASRRLAAKHVELRTKIRAALTSIRICTVSSQRSGRRSSSGMFSEGILMCFPSLDAAQSFQAYLESLLTESRQTPFRNGDVIDADKVRSRLQLEVETVLELQDLRNSLDIVAVEKMIARINGLSLASFSAVKDLAMEDRLPKLKVQVPLFKSIQSAIDDFQAVQRDSLGSSRSSTGSTDPGDSAEAQQLKCVVDAVKDLGLESSEKWLDGLEGGELFKRADELWKGWEVHYFEEQKAKKEQESKETVVAALAQTKGSAKTAIESAKDKAKLAMESADPRLAKMAIDSARDSTKAALESAKASARTALESAKDAAKDAHERAFLNIPDAADDDEAKERWLPWLWKKVNKTKKSSKDPKDPKKKKKKGADRDSSVSSGKSAASSSAEQGDGQKQVMSMLLRSVSLLGKLDKEEWGEIADGLKNAVEVYDAAALEDCLKRAVEAGMPADELDMAHHMDYQHEDSHDSQDSEGDVGSLVAAARRMFEKLQTEEYLIQTLVEVEEEIEMPDPPTLALKKLENIALQLEKTGLEEEAAGAREKLQKQMVVRRKSRVMERGVNVAVSMDPEELGLAARTFGNLAMFSQLKLASDWGTQTGATFHAQEGRKAVMLSHSKICIPESLLRVPNNRDAKDYEAVAMKNFRDILIFMGDRPAQDCQRQASFNAVIARAASDPALCNEVYVQMLKQLTGNPSTLSVQLGWKLLHRLCQQTLPGDEFVEFVRSFLQCQAETGEALSACRACMLELDRASNRKCSDVSAGSASPISPAADKGVQSSEFSEFSLMTREDSNAGAPSRADQRVAQIDPSQKAMANAESEVKPKGKGKGKEATFDAESEVKPKAKGKGKDATPDAESEVKPKAKGKGKEATPDAECEVKPKVKGNGKEATPDAESGAKPKGKGNGKEIQPDAEPEAKPKGKGVGKEPTPDAESEAKPKGKSKGKEVTPDAESEVKPKGKGKVKETTPDAEPEVKPNTKGKGKGKGKGSPAQQDSVEPESSQKQDEVKSKGSSASSPSPSSPPSFRFRHGTDVSDDSPKRRGTDDTDPEGDQNLQPFTITVMSPGGGIVQKNCVASNPPFTISLVAPTGKAKELLSLSTDNFPQWPSGEDDDV